MTATVYTMDETATVKFSGPFTVTYVRDSGETATRSATWRALHTILPVIGRMADRGKLHSIDVLDRHGNSVVFASDVLPLLEKVTVVHTDRADSHGQPGHTGTPGTCAACHYEEFEV